MRTVVLCVRPNWHEARQENVAEPETSETGPEWVAGE